MATTTRGSVFPGWFLAGAAGLMGLAIVSAGIGRYQKAINGPAPMPAVVAEVSIRFEARPDGSMLIRRLPDDRVIEHLPTDGSGFMRGIQRSLNRDRAMRQLDRDAPYRLVKRANGRHAVIDPLSGERIELDGFGPSHSQHVGRLIDQGQSQTGLSTPSLSKNQN
ncbi:MAG: photosynthetic complex assembly protein PuhC [Beijerinckiaceae bacterium]|nr:photosynthetic complex assembly protein PuhC [Beijerinckiaceae bacterium]